MISTAFYSSCKDVGAHTVIISILNILVLPSRKSSSSNLLLFLPTYVVLPHTQGSKLHSSGYYYYFIYVENSNAHFKYVVISYMIFHYCYCCVFLCKSSTNIITSYFMMLAHQKSDMDTDGVSVKVEPSYQDSITFSYHVTDGSSRAV